MRVATIRIRKDDAAVLRQAGATFAEAWRSGEAPTDVFTFSSPAQLFSVLTPRRWTLIEHLQALGPVSLRGLARALGRDVKRVHEDVACLLDWGLVSRTDERKLHSPYAVIHADFDIRAAA